MPVSSTLGNDGERESRNVEIGEVDKGNKEKQENGPGWVERPDNTPHMYKVKKKQGKGASKIRQNNRT